jgi:chromosome segregation ATPase
MERQTEEFDSNIQCIDADIEQEYTTIQYQYALKLKKEHDAFKEIQTENQKMKNEYDVLSKQIEENKSGLNKMFSEERRLQNIIKGLEKDIVGLRREVFLYCFKLCRFRKEMILFSIKISAYLI